MAEDRTTELFPRPIAAVIVGAIALATVAAILWSSRPPERAPIAVTAPTEVGIIVEQIPEEGAAPRIGARAPDFRWVAPDGSRRTLADLRGRPIVLNFWATWCVPCRAEMPLLERAAEADPQIAFMAIDLDEDGATVRAFFDQFGLEHIEPLIDVGLVTSRRYALASLPVTFFVDRTGIIRHLAMGEMDADDLERALAKIRR